MVEVSEKVIGHLAQTAPAFFVRMDRLHEWGEVGHRCERYNRGLANTTADDCSCWVRNLERALAGILNPRGKPK